MRNGGKRMAMIAVLSAALVAGHAQFHPAQAESGAATPFGPALLGATLAVFGLGGTSLKPAPSAPPRAVPTRGMSEIAEHVPPVKPPSAGRANATPAR